MTLSKKCPKLEKQAMVTVGKLKGHLQKVEGLLTGFQQNISQAFEVNQKHQETVKNLDNAKAHDIWKTISYGIASVGLFALTWWAPPGPLTLEDASYIGLETFGEGIVLKGNEDACKQIRLKQYDLHRYARGVDKELKDIE